MDDLEEKIRSRFLNTLSNPSWDDEDPRLDFGVSALPFFTAAFEKETTPERRAKLVRVIWQFRDLAALPTLAVALRDPNDEVWRDALDGIVSLASKEAVAILKLARIDFTADPAALEKCSWIDEAIGQVLEKI